MVEIRIVIEGGIIPNQNDSLQTINGSEKLRESFHRLLGQIIKPNFSFNLIIEMAGGNQSAVNSFNLYSKNDNKLALLIDLDGDKKTKSEKILSLGINILYSKNVFFMVQEFESWILSQPESIKKACDARFIKRNRTISIENDINNLHNGNFEDIVKPSIKLKEILGKHYFELKRNQKVKIKYGKIKDVPFLLENLEANNLIATFEDLRLLKCYIEERY